MEYCLNMVGNLNTLTQKERNLLIRYCLTVGTRAKCLTKVLLRPLKMKDLNAAFEEARNKQLAQIEKYERKAREYDPENPQLDDFLLAYFEGVPSKEVFSDYCTRVIRQCREFLRGMKREYAIHVQYRFIGRKLLAFHRSLNPRVTFGYSSVLHEECDFALDEPTRQAFLGSSLSKPSRGEDDWEHDWGYVVFGRNFELVYEDLTVFRGEACILETTSHEEEMTVWLDDNDLSALADMEGGKELIEKLSAAS